MVGVYLHSPALSSSSEPASGGETGEWPLPDGIQQKEGVETINTLSS